MLYHKVKLHIEKINGTLNENSLNNSIIVLYKLGSYLQKKAPDQKLEFYQQLLKNEAINFSHIPLPGLELLSYIISAREELVEQFTEDKNKLDFLTHLLIGINCYLSVMDNQTTNTDESRITKAFEALGGIRKIYPALVKDNIKECINALLDYSIVKDNSELSNFSTNYQLMSIVDLDFPTQITELKVSDLTTLANLNTITTPLFGLTPEELDDISFVLNKMTTLQNTVWSQIHDNSLEVNKAKTNFQKLMQILNDSKKSITHYYSNHRDLTAKLVLSQQMTKFLNSIELMIQGTEAQTLLKQLAHSKIWLHKDELTAKITLQTYLDQLTIETNKINQKDPDKKIILTFIDNITSALNVYYLGNRNLEAKQALNNKLNLLIKTVEPAINRNHSFKEKFNQLCFFIRDVLTLGSYAYFKTGHYGFYKAPTRLSLIQKEFDQ